MYESLVADTKEILALCNALICKYVSGNVDNQEEVFKHLDLFVSTINMGIGSVGVVQEVFRFNETLISRFPLKVSAHRAQLPLPSSAPSPVLLPLTPPPSSLHFTPPPPSLPLPQLIGEIAEDIAESSLDPELLGVLQALSSSHGAQPHVEIQLQILRELTQPGRLGKIIFLANDPETEDFKERRRLCEVRS